ncbi:class I SAM-dependent methyltransferase [Asticcacaulis biprosthecium]|nr:class I SAM-dependent methyltransferase [Asticcacaulis biprosthecium]
MAGLTALLQRLFQDGHELVIDGSLRQEIGPFVSQTSTDPVSPEQLAVRFCDSHRALHDEIPSVLDYGCGSGIYRGMLENAGFVWRGVQPAGLPGSGGDPQPEVDACEDLRLPYDDASFDAVFAFQIFCYLRDPDLALSEIARVLKPNGIVFGAAGYLEQVHDHSLYNLTPLGLKAAAVKAGLRLEEIHAAYDVFSWMFHRLRAITTARNDLQDLIRRDNFFHDLCVEYGLRLGRPVADINLLKLTLCPHITFLIRKPG